MDEQVSVVPTESVTHVWFVRQVGKGALVFPGPQRGLVLDMDDRGVTAYVRHGAKIGGSDTPPRYEATIMVPWHLVECVRDVRVPVRTGDANGTGLEAKAGSAGTETSPSNTSDAAEVAGQPVPRSTKTRRGPRKANRRSSGKKSR